MEGASNAYPAAVPRLPRFLVPATTASWAENVGWVRSMDTSLRQMTLTLVVDWQAATAFAAIATLGWAGWPLFVANLATAGYALFALYSRRVLPTSFLPLIMGILGFCGYLVSGNLDSLMSFTASWQINFATLSCGLLFRGRWVIPTVTGAAAALSLPVALLLPHWGFRISAVIVLTQAAIIIAVRLGYPLVDAMARVTDADEEATARALRRAEVARRASSQAAEEARLLHDTAINTLGAIANGGRSVSDLEQVRQQCARDVERLKVLRGERSVAAREHSLRGIFEPAGFPVVRRGLDDDALAVLERRLDQRVVAAMVGATHEAIRNAAKHSGAPAADITVFVEDNMLRVVVSDEGVGFSGVFPDTRGLANSVVGRAEQAGIDAVVRSAPAAGTVVELVAPLDRDPDAQIAEPVDPAQVPAFVLGVARRAASLWALGVTVVGLVLTVAGGGDHTLVLLPMIALMLVAWIGDRIVRGTPGPAMHAGLILLTGLVFLLSAAATDFGRADPSSWQALAATGPFVLLLSYGPPMRVAVLSMMGWAALAVALASTVVPGSPHAAGIILAAAWVGLAFSLFVARLRVYVAILCAKAADARRVAFRADVEAEAERAAQASYRRWVDAGLDEAIALLGDIAEGARDPEDPSTRADCDIEERYLRQLVLISPDLVHLGPRLIPVLRHARERGIALALRLGGRDAADDQTAEAVSSAVMRVLSAARPGTSVAASVFPVGDGLHLTIAGPRRAVESLPEAYAQVQIHAESSEDLNLAEMAFPDASPSPDTVNQSMM
ncbi:MAG: hypothetical protein IPJ61_11730 [Tessaracoccus sp.]|uniref:sensor histidine kinase n=1 Tax=Tessaracoccus sp. TaxID=1971211 RepID=UPI001EC9AD95|nr:hypothetical protein [Tessaracoccus sp.]MBK7821710.1 hypothetical protein [Tessaracoccus sp.]